jgi:flavin reductase (DIM6/NTAB) family NADH-FMN oxidoreductase RutF
MKREPISVQSFRVRLFETFADRWFLLAAGKLAPRAFNAMTISWGGLGVLWDRPLVWVVVRPQRYTFKFMEESPDFTVCAFPPRFRDALMLLGTKSGRDSDKIKEAGLTPVASTQVQSPSFAEAELAIECRKIYFDDFKPAHFLDKAIDRNYPQKDYHRLYLGEVLAIQGTKEYRGD